MTLLKMNIIKMEAVSFELKTRCCVCDKFLSVPPVYLSENGSTCGRCPPQGCRNRAYEDLAKVLKFPCCYEGCVEKLNWEAASQHEQVCQYQLVCCPFTACEKEFKLYTIKSHFEAQHKKNFLSQNVLSLKDRFKNVPKSAKRVFLMCFDDKLVLIVIKNVWQKLQNFAEWEYNFGVFNLGPAAPDIQYDIVIKFNYDDGFHISSASNSLDIKSFNNVSHNFTDDAFLTHKMSNIDKHSDITVDITLEINGKYMELENAKEDDIKMRKCLDELKYLFVCECCENNNPEIYCTQQKKILCNSCFQNCNCSDYSNNINNYHVMQNELQGFAEAINNLQKPTVSVTNTELIGFLVFVNNSFIYSPKLKNMVQPIKKMLELKGFSF